MKQAAKLLGAHAQSLANWEEGKTAPVLRYVRSILEFLGYDPRPVPEDFSGRLIHHRVGLGMSQVSVARLLGVDPGTLRRWESGRRRPHDEYVMRVKAALKTGSR